MKTKRKAILVIVEGPSDETVFEPFVQSIFSDSSIQNYIVRGDLTVQTPQELGSDRGNVLNAVSAVFKKHLNKYKLHAEDFIAIFQIADLDGVYLDKKYFVQKENLIKPRYYVDHIEVSDPQQLLKRNIKKTANLNKLIQYKELTCKAHKIPYYIFYMSCNLEHVCFDKFNFNDDEKKDSSSLFAQRYTFTEDPRVSFLRFFKRLMPESVQVEQDHEEKSLRELYEKSWNAVAQIQEKIPRATNIALVENIAWQHATKAKETKKSL